MPDIYFYDSNESKSINNIYCIGRNYADHIKELGNKEASLPLVFIKPNSALNTAHTITLPTFSHNIHYETELVLLIGKSGKNIQPQHAEGYIAAIAIGLDLTARDLQQQAKVNGHPWTIAKGFDQAASVSSFIPVDAKLLANFNQITFEMELNNSIKQRGHISDMLFKTNFIISMLSDYFTLQAGDLIFTGTPQGVGQLQPGDIIRLSLNIPQRNPLIATFNVV